MCYYFSMQVVNFRKYISANIISILGYIALWFVLFYQLVLLPESNAYYEARGLGSEDNFDASLAFVLFFMKYLYIFGAIILLLIIEFFIRKKIKFKFLENISAPKLLDNAHKVLFWIGVVLSPMPLYVAMCVYARFLSDFYLS